MEVSGVERDKTVQDLINRMKRIEGQARGVQRMLAEGRHCEELIMQLSAMRAAIGKVALAVLGNYLEECLLTGVGEEREKAIERAKELFLKFS